MALQSCHEMGNILWLPKAMGELYMTTLRFSDSIIIYVLLLISRPHRLLVSMHDDCFRDGLIEQGLEIH
jgi:hypothetical protein